LLQIKNELQQSGYKTWMDVDNLVGGNLMEVLGKAVKNSAVFLLCMSSSYEKSAYCQSVLLILSLKLG